MNQDVEAEVTLDNTGQEFEFTEVSNEINPTPSNKFSVFIFIINVFNNLFFFSHRIGIIQKKTRSSDRKQW